MQPAAPLPGVVVKDTNLKGIPYMKHMTCLMLASLLLLCACAPGSASAPAPAAEQPAQEAQQTAASPSYPQVPEISGYEDFCSVISAELIDGTRNSNLSPVSIYLALAMTAEGAGGSTRDAMLALLGCESIEELRSICSAMLDDLSMDSEDSTLALADSIWIASDDSRAFSESYLKSLADIYRSEAAAVDFTKAETGALIADWITKNTRGKIRISPDAMQFDADTLAVLINTIYLRDAWADEFREGATEAGTFFTPGGELTADYMNRRDYGVTIVQGDGFTRYSLPLMRVGRMTFVLPDESTSFSDLLGTPERIQALLNGGEEIRANVSVKLPKFRFQDRFDLNDTLKALGIGIAFSGSADFSGMGDFQARISQVLQESFIGVDEKGVEAAAYTMVVMAKGAALPQDLPDIDFHLTRPFLYAIESHDGTVLFIGTVTDPGSEA